MKGKNYEKENYIRITLALERHVKLRKTMKMSIIPELFWHWNVMKNGGEKTMKRRIIPE